MWSDIHHLLMPSTRRRSGARTDSVDQARFFTSKLVFVFVNWLISGSHYSTRGTPISHVGMLHRVYGCHRVMNSAIESWA